MDQDTRELRDSIARERAELAETIEALAHKADVKARIREETSARVEQLRETAPGPVEWVRSHPVATAVVVALAVGFLCGRLSRRARSRVSGEIPSMVDLATALRVARDCA